MTDGDQLSRGKAYPAPILPSDGAMAAAQTERPLRGRGQAILAKGLIESYREILDWGVPAPDVCKFAVAVAKTLTRMPAEALVGRLKSLGKKLEADVRRPRPPVGK